jgi:hypothetical protein
MHARASTMGFYDTELSMRVRGFVRRGRVLDFRAHGHHGLDVCHYPNSDDLEGADDHAEEDHSCFCAFAGYLVRPYLFLHLSAILLFVVTDSSPSSASIATLIRVKYLVELSDYSDILFTGTTAMVWTLIEPGLAITAASLITIRPLLRAMNFTGFNSTGNNTSRNLTSNNNLSRSMGQHNLSQRRDNFALENWNALSSVTGPEEAVVKGKGGERIRSEPLSDAESEQYILQGRGVEDLEDGIRQTRTVTVVIDPRSRAGSLNKGSSRL